MPLYDTIAAIATPPGQGGIAIVRVSGENAPAIMRALLRPEREIKYRYMHLGRLEFNGDILDEALCVLFEKERSFTGEYVFEAHCHGGSMAASLVLDACIQLGARPAQPGEFTKRAFINGKISLDKAEAVGALISARTSLAARLAARGLGGELDRKIKEFQNKIADLIAAIEAGFDYPDELEQSGESLGPELDELSRQLDALTATYSTGRLLASGITVCIAGRPNAGKSSLLNALAGRQCAIVTAQAGTTRDVLSVELELDGICVRILDTAGLRDEQGICEAERLGIARAKEQAESADIVLYVIDGAAGESREDAEAVSTLEAKGQRVIKIYNKCDLAQGHSAGMQISALTGHGLDGLKERIFKEAGLTNLTEGLIITNARHSAALKAASEALKSARAAAEFNLDCASIDLRAALSALEEITGESAGANMVDRIFEKFCLGK